MYFFNFYTSLFGKVIFSNVLENMRDCKEFVWSLCFILISNLILQNSLLQMDFMLSFNCLGFKIQ